MESRISVQVKLLHPDAKAPSYGRSGDAGLDVYSVEDVVLFPGEKQIVKTGIAMAIPEGCVALVWDRSGVAAKGGIKTMGGVIDHTYRGEYGIIMTNLTKTAYQVNKGDRIAQVLIQPIYTADITVVDELSDSVRGSGGFGSSGR